MTITAHFVNDNYELKSFVLQPKGLDEKHMGENISVALSAALESWQIAEKVSVITTDNASNIGCAIHISDKDLQTVCFAHTLDLAAKKAVKLAQPLSRKMKPVISFLHRCHTGGKTLNVPSHQLITDVETRWNSTHIIFEQRVAIHATFLNKRLESHRDTYKD